jgi:hypothetical protein
MNSTSKDFDWHRKGVYAAVAPDNTLLWGTFAADGYSARAELIRQINRPWSSMAMDGYVIREFVAAESIQLCLF